MVNRGWEDKEARRYFVLHPGGPLLVALVGQGYSKMDLHTRVTTEETYSTEMLPGITGSWHRADIEALDSSP